jgi:hypothetical protein
MDVSSTEMKGLRETETFDRENIGNIRKYMKNNTLICFNSHMVYKIDVK